MAFEWKIGMNGREITAYSRDCADDIETSPLVLEVERIKLMNPLTQEELLIRQQNATELIGGTLETAQLDYAEAIIVTDKMSDERLVKRVFVLVNDGFEIFSLKLTFLGKIDNTDEITKRVYYSLFLIERPAEEQTEVQAEKQVEELTEEQSKVQAEERTEKQAEVKAEERIDERIEERAEKRAEKQAEKQTEKQTEKQIEEQIEEQSEKSEIEPKKKKSVHLNFGAGWQIHKPDYVISVPEAFEWSFGMNGREFIAYRSGCYNNIDASPLVVELARVRLLNPMTDQELFIRQQNAAQLIGGTIETAQLDFGKAVILSFTTSDERQVKRAFVMLDDGYEMFSLQLTFSGEVDNTDEITKRIYYSLYISQTEKNRTGKNKNGNTDT
ncbi:MAG: hypothetical protein ACI4RP_06130, partial [Acutalibacteraceae bacterium]